jgi:nucleoside-diphosphate-sugar epimerase
MGGLDPSTSKKEQTVRVLVTGSAGHIGKWQVEALQAAGHTVRTFDRTARRKKDAGEHIPGDVRDILAVRQAVEGMDAVVHMGALSHDGKGTPEDLLAVNVQGTWNVLLACAEAEISRVIFYSSIHALGNFGGHRPAAYLPIDDAYPHHPLTPYQISKHLGEELCKAFSDRYGMVTVSLRPVYVAAPTDYAYWNRYRLEERQERVRGDYWAYVDVRDVCQAALLGLTAENITSEAFLLTADDTISATPTAELVERFYPETPWPKQSRDVYLADNPYRSLLDCVHAKTVLGWQPRHSWRDSAAAP